jgi:exopolysaccharide production protein ExoZ
VYNGIRTLRAFAAIAIVVFHVTEYLRGNRFEGDWLFRLSGPGVHLFVLVSGFLAVIGIAPNEKPGAYLVRRAARLAPLYWLLTLLVIGLAAIRPWFYPTADLSPAGIVSSLLFIPSYDLSGELSPILFVGWTLNYIVLFHLLASLSLFAPQRWRGAALMVLIAALFFGARATGDGAVANFVGAGMFMEFALGCGVGLLASHPRVIAWFEHRSAWPLAIIAVAALAVTIQTSEGATRDKVLSYGLPMALLLFAVAVQERKRPMATHPVFTWIGERGFSIYLIHPVVIPLAGVATVRLAGDGVAGGAALIGVTLAATLVLAQVFSVYFEKPVGAWLIRVLGAERRGARRRIAA